MIWMMNMQMVLLINPIPKIKMFRNNKAKMRMMKISLTWIISSLTQMRDKKSHLSRMIMIKHNKMKVELKDGPTLLQVDLHCIKNRLKINLEWAQPTLLLNKLEQWDTQVIARHQLDLVQKVVHWENKNHINNSTLTWFQIQCLH